MSTVRYKGRPQLSWAGMCDSGTVRYSDKYSQHFHSTCGRYHNYLYYIKDRVSENKNLIQEKNVVKIDSWLSKNKGMHFIGGFTYCWFLLLYSPMYIIVYKIKPKGMLLETWLKMTFEKIVFFAKFVLLVFLNKKMYYKPCLTNICTL